MTIRTINNAHYTWWSLNQEPPICPLLGQSTKPAYKQCKIKENHNLKSKWAQKLYDENMCHVNITKRIVIPFFIHFIIVLFQFWQNPIVFQAHLYPTLRPTLWFQRWPQEKRSIVDGPYWSHRYLFWQHQTLAPYKTMGFAKELNWIT